MFLWKVSKFHKKTKNPQACNFPCENWEFLWTPILKNMCDDCFWNDTPDFECAFVIKVKQISQPKDTWNKLDIYILSIFIWKFIWAICIHLFVNICFQESKDEMKIFNDGLYFAFIETKHHTETVVRGVL